MVIKNLHLKSIRVHGTRTGNEIHVGGMTGSGRNITRIEGSSVEGKISGLGGLVGGIVGGVATYRITIQNSYADVTVTGTRHVGGIVGKIQGGAIFNSHVRGSVTRTGSGHGGAGGIAGQLEQGGQIYNSYSHASVSGVSRVGSLVGDTSSSAFLVNSYGTGSVGGSGTKKGISGAVSSSTLTNNFWDTETTGQAADTSQGAGLPTASMKVACAQSSTTGICALGSAFVFTQGSYPKIKKCTSGCDTGSPTLSNDLVIGQD